MSPFRSASIALAIVLPLAVTGCATTGGDPAVALATDTVIPVSVGEARFVPAYNLADAMLRAGFGRDEILKYGPTVHNALATSGGAQVRQGKQVSAIFAVYGNRLYVTSLSRGTFTQDLGAA